MRKFLPFLFLVVFAATVDAATTRYVSPSGSGSTCSSPSPCSLSTGAAATASGDTLVLKDGTYNGRLSNAITSGSSGAPTIVMAENTRLAILKPTSGSQQAITFTDDSWIEVRGIRVDMSGIGADAPDGVKIDGTSHDIEFLDVEVGNLPNASGFVTRSTTARINVRRCYVHDTTDTTTSNGFHGFYWSAADSIIEYCRIENIDGYGIQLYETTGLGGANTIIRYNTFTGGTKKSAYVNSIGTGVKFYNNLIWANSGGVAERKCNSNTQYINNVFYNNTGTGLALSDLGANCPVLAANNIALSNSVSQISNSGGGATLTTNRTSGTPTDLMIDPANANFNLKESSAAIDAGTAITGFSEGRYVGSAPDQGAFEAPIRSSAVVQDATDTTYSITFSLPTQSTGGNGTAGTGLQTCTVGNFAVTVAAAGATESSCAISGTSRVDITLGAAVTVGQALTDAMTRSTAPTLTDNVCIGDPNTTCYNAQVRTYSAAAGTNNVDGGALPAFTQTRYRFHALRGTEASPTNLASENTSITLPRGAAFRLRVKFRTDDDPDATTFKLRYSKDAGAYTDIPDTVGADGIAWYGTAGSSDIPSAGSATTELLTSDEATNVACAVVRSSSDYPLIDFNNGESECEYALQINNGVAVGTTYDFRVYKGDNTALDTYSVTPRLTIGQYIAGL